MQLVVPCLATTPITHPLDVVRQESVDGHVLGARGERVCCLAVINDLFHGFAVGLVGSSSALVIVGVYDHDIEGVSRRFGIFCFGDQCICQLDIFIGEVDMIFKGLV